MDEGDLSGGKVASHHHAMCSEILSMTGIRSCQCPPQKDSLLHVAYGFYGCLSFLNITFQSGLAFLFLHCTTLAIDL